MKKGWFHPVLLLVAVLLIVSCARHPRRYRAPVDLPDNRPDMYLSAWPQAVDPGRKDAADIVAGPLRRKAEQYDAWNETHHQPFYGGIVRVNFTDSSRTAVKQYEGWRDSTMWTGVYLGGQAMRYGVTGDQQAAVNARRMVLALHHHLKITGRPGFLARYRAPRDPLVYGGDKWCNGPEGSRCHQVKEGPYAGDFWFGDTSRDQYTGWFFGMVLAYDLLDDEETRGLIRADVADVLHALIAQQWIILDVDGLPVWAAPIILPVLQLTWLTIGYHVTGDPVIELELKRRLRNSYRRILAGASSASGNRYRQYFANNQLHINWYNLLRLGRLYFSEADWQFLLELFENNVHTFTRLSHNPWFNGIYMSQGAYGGPGGDDPYLAQLLGDLTEFRDPPLHRYRLPERTGYPVNPKSVRLHNTFEPFPFVRRLIGDVKTESKKALPVSLQCSTDFMWQRSPFRLGACGKDDPSFVNPGVDYLAAYWLAAYHGLVDQGR